MDFVWDESHAQINYVKHVLSFVEAVQVFQDVLSGVFKDPDHSFEEDRFIIMGMTGANRLLFVSYTEREDKIRIISAREATLKERKRYEKQS